MTTSFKRAICSLVIFGISFGYLEAAVVEYLRALYDPIRHRLHGDYSPENLFPVLRLDELEKFAPESLPWLKTELLREAATLAMLAGMGIALGRNFREAFAGFLVAFGIWDISFYAFLRVLLGWPHSVLEWDLLFLLPVPWAGPVLAPLLVASAMIMAGCFVLYRESWGNPVRISCADWIVLVTGGFMLVGAFCWHAPTTLAGNQPGPFPWPLFALGLAVGLAGFMRAVSSSSAAISRKPR
jgi:hypothetical protein